MKHTNQQPVESQFGLWSYFQNQRTASFDAARGRLDMLIRYAGRWAPGKSLLNVGCGNGYLERTARGKNWSVVSVDPDKDSVAKLISAGIDARCGFIQSLPVTTASIDVVICSEVLEHIPVDTLRLAFREIWRVLTPKGVLIGTVPYREDFAENEVFCPHCESVFHRWGHQQSFDEAKMTSLLEPSLRVRVMRPKYFPNWPAPNWKIWLSSAARYVFSFVGVYGSCTKLMFVASKASDRCT